jgi:DNA replicative helicase MCM subunit Mcm2 (Cdc46/Mcm family)
MGKEDSIWKEWKCIGIVDGKQYATCNHCGHRLQVNATRFKHHIVTKCESAPDYLKAKFVKVVAEQSISSNNQKRKMLESLQPTDDSDSERGSNFQMDRQLRKTSSTSTNEK